MRSRPTRPLLGAATIAVTAALLLAGCAPAADTSTAGSTETTKTQSTVLDSTAWDATKVCGDKQDVKVALADGTGGNTWRKIVLANLKAEAAKCSNVSEVLYSNANGDAQKATADINGFVSQGVDVLIVLPDFGVSQLPALRSATAAGVTVIPYYVELPSGTKGTDFTDNVYLDNYQLGVSMGAWMADTLQSGKVLMLGGAAGCASCQDQYDGVKKGLAANSDLTLIGTEPTATDYSPATAQQAVAGALTKEGSIAGLVADYGVTAQAGLEAFDAAGEDLPALSISTGQNGIYCTWKDDKDAGKDFAFSAFEGSSQIVRAAFRRGMADLNGITWDEPLGVTLPASVDTEAGDDPPCDPSKASDTDMFSGLTDAETEAALAG